MSAADEGWNSLSGIADGPRMNATFVTLARNSDVWEIARSIRQIEDRFNRRYNYDWVFLNDKPFDATFKKITTSLVSGKTHYGEIPKEHWSFPDFIDQEKARKVREDMKQRKIIYGDSVSYRHMCRFESGFFFRQPLMMNYDYYWRVEPSVELFCDIHYDPFRYMKENGKKYSFVLSLYEYVETIPTMWDSVKKFMTNHPEHIAEGNSMGFLSDDGGETYNHCHFVCFPFLLEQPAIHFTNRPDSGPTSRSATSTGSARKRISTTSNPSTRTAASSTSVGVTRRCTPSPPVYS
jgi:alpha 1,2-mannosyltransferase